MNSHEQACTAMYSYIQAFTAIHRNLQPVLDLTDYDKNNSDVLVSTFNPTLIATHSMLNKGPSYLISGLIQ